MSKILKRSFFQRPTLKVAPELLGKAIVLQSKSNKRNKYGIIIEVEAYTKDDPACHAARGKTLRNAVMFGPPGYTYVYFIYGMYFCLNVITEKEGIPGAILIRALEIPNHKDKRIASGPGKLCNYLKVTKTYNNLDSCNKDSPLIITDDNNLHKSFQTVQTKRIGISQAAHHPWRWYIKDNPSVSKL